MFHSRQLARETVTWTQLPPPITIPVDAAR
jgi:hypothetical protein